MGTSFIVEGCNVDEHKAAGVKSSYIFKINIKNTRFSVLKLNKIKILNKKIPKPFCKHWYAGNA